MTPEEKEHEEKLAALVLQPIYPRFRLPMRLIAPTPDTSPSAMVIGGHSR